ncbi:MAG: four helix bundle protein [Bacteroidota bacterium]
MAKVENFEDLKVWQLAREICNDIWYLLENTSLSRDFELKNQMSRSSGSIMDNIAEGFERNGTREFIQFLSISKGSRGELRAQLYRALDRKHITKEQFDIISEKRLSENKRIGSFMAYLNKINYRGDKFTGEANSLKNEQVANPQPPTLNDK